MVTVAELLSVPFKVRVFRKLELAARVSEVKLSAKLAAAVKLLTDCALFASVTVVPANFVSMQTSSVARGTLAAEPSTGCQFVGVVHWPSAGAALPVHRIVGAGLVHAVVPMPVTVMFTEEEELGLGLVSFSEAVAVLVTEPAIVALATMDAVAEAPTARLPRVQLMVLVPMQVPWLGVAETRVRPAARGSVKITPVEGAGPLFVTVMV